MLLLHQLRNLLADKQLSFFVEMQPVFAEHIAEEIPLREATRAKIDQADRELARDLFDQQRIHLLVAVDLLHIAKPPQDIFV